MNRRAVSFGTTGTSRLDGRVISKSPSDPALDVCPQVLINQRTMDELSQNGNAVPAHPGAGLKILGPDEPPADEDGRP
jgi:hypothetical protein